MKRLSACLAAASFALVPALPSHAQTVEEAKEMVLGLYVVSIAIDACNLDLSKDQETRLDHWIGWAEKKLDIADRKLDKAYASMEEAVEKDKSAFCKEMSPVAKQVLKDLPAPN